ncbi:MAG TPA: enoyl-CoA hydratase/isomerase family protein, partial [Bacteroidota bacterium]|nr:enoyl-CoA hydratase/isomerase family protein [Bacteroidota bacterium]
ARRAYELPMGFLELMDATGLAIGFASMKSFSDASDPHDALRAVYGNFFEPRPVYAELVARQARGEKPSEVRWICERENLASETDPKIVENLAGRFLAVGFMTAAETVDAGLITIGDLDSLTQNAFLWKKGPFEIMNGLGKNRVRELVKKRAALAEKLGHDFPVSDLLRVDAGKREAWTFHIACVSTETRRGDPVRRITLSNPRSANAVNDDVFRELDREFSAANDDPECAVIIFDTAPIKSFIAGADVRAFREKIAAGKFDEIRDGTAEWQRVIFKSMTGSGKAKIVIVDGSAFGGGVEIACAFAGDPDSVVLITNRTSFALPETRLGIYPGLRGTLTLPQVIHRKTGNPEYALAIARYYTLAGGTATSSPQVIHRLGFAHAIVPQNARDDAADMIARAIVSNNGRIPGPEILDALGFPRLGTSLSDADATELEVAAGMFSQADLIPTLVAQGRGHLPIFYSGPMRSLAERTARRVALNSPNAVGAADHLLSRGFRGYLDGEDNDALAAFELDHFLVPVFRHPDARIGIEALLDGKFPEFKRRYPFD